MCRGQRRDLADIIGRRYFDNVHSNNVDAFQAAQNRHCLVTGQATTHWRTGSGCIARIQTVDIKRHVYGLISQVLPCFGNDGFDSALVNIGRVNNIEAHRVGVLGSQPDLYR